MTLRWPRAGAGLISTLRQVRTVRHLRTVRSLFILLTATAVMLLIAAPAAAQAPADTTDLAADPCLTGDPYRLAELTRVLSNASPSTDPIRIGDHITAQYVDHSKMSDTGPDEIEPGFVRDPSREPNEPYTDTLPLDGSAIRVFNTRTLAEFRVSLSDTLLRDIYDCHERTSRTAPGGPADLDIIEGSRWTLLPLLQGGAGRPAVSAAQVAGPAAPDGWSNNHDSRIVRTQTTAWPWRTISQSASDPNGEQSRCTLTLIGPRHMVTAAHCVVEFGTSNWKTRKLTPGRNGTGSGSEPYGTTRMTPNPPPGTEAWYFVPDPWMNPSTTNKWQWDIAVVVVTDRIGEKTGWMGYGAWSASDLNTRTHYNRGYPSCNTDYPERPANCQIARLYGDTKSCKIGDYYNTGSNGWNRSISVSCDLSRGHSGSAIYHYRYDPKLGKTVPVVAAVVSWHECLTCAPGDDYPNHARRITPWVRDVISWLREEFP
jgi:V8-like Glu-specific endopeptidase